jgi:8-oxo-dGTP diphosphatase
LTVLAAGGVVWRHNGTGNVEVLIVHRPKYDDWTFPKGKLAPGEGAAEGALREVAEETGLRCSLGQELASTSYVDSAGRPKTVRYWSMVADGGQFRANDEVDEVRWVPVEEAPAALSYDRDRDVLASFQQG